MSLLVIVAGGCRPVAAPVPAADVVGASAAGAPSDTHSASSAGPGRPAALAVAATPTAARPRVEWTFGDEAASPGPAPPVGSGRSIGTPQEGWLEGGVRAPIDDLPGLAATAITRRRDWLWGTPTLIALLRDAAVSLREEAIAAWQREPPPLRLGNLSRPGGGDIAPSRSHNSGRDVDIAFFHIDGSGQPVDAPHLVLYGDDGVAVAPAVARGRWHFDVERNWLLVRHLLSNARAIVQWIFVAAPLRNMLLDHALRIGEPEAVRLRAARVLVQPTDSSPHADHFHLRIACPPADRPRCIDGPGRTAAARQAQIDALLHLYHHGSPAEQRYAREILSIPAEGGDLFLPPDGEHDADADDASDPDDGAPSAGGPVGR